MGSNYYVQTHLSMNGKMKYIYSQLNFPMELPVDPIKFTFSKYEVEKSSLVS